MALHRWVRTYQKWTLLLGKENRLISNEVSIESHCTQQVPLSHLLLDQLRFPIFQVIIHLTPNSVFLSFRIQSPSSVLHQCKLPAITLIFAAILLLPGQLCHVNIRIITQLWLSTFSHQVATTLSFMPTLTSRPLPSRPLPYRRLAHWSRRSVLLTNEQVTLVTQVCILS